MNKFRNKYRIASHRKPGWDYSANGLYFITLVTQHRICNLGDVVDSKMKLSDFGKIVHQEWLKSFEIRAELFCDEYVIMPNHLHAIVEINKPVDTHGQIVDSHDQNVDTHGRAYQRRNEPLPQINSTEPIEPLNQKKRNMPVRLPKSISSFIAGFKSAVNTKIDDYIDLHQLNIPKYNRNNHFFQSNYHDRIIRDEMEYQRIKKYIINNPYCWKTDKLNNKSLEP